MQLGLCAVSIQLPCYVACTRYIDMPYINNSCSLKEFKDELNEKQRVRI